MDLRRLGGADGFDITVVGLGCNAFGRRLDEVDSTPVIHAALDAGINFFDTAEIYADGLTEEFIGRALEGRRHEVILATKFGLRTLNVPGKGRVVVYRELGPEKRSGHVYRLRTEPAMTESFFEGIDSVEILEMNDAEWTIEFGSFETLDAIIDGLRRDGVRIVELAPHRSSLTELYDSTREDA